MARPSTKVKVITGRDQSLLKQLSKTGISTTYQAEKFCKLSNSRIEKLEKSGYIKTSSHIVRGESCKVIQLDKLGKDYCRQEFGTQSYCIAQTNHLEHDIKLTETYYSLDSNIQDTWKHENQIINEYYTNNPDIERGSLTTCIDATVEINGEVIAIESVGDSYSKATIEIKHEIALNLGCSRMECV